MHDFGYDVSDYYSIQPEYGNMEDFEQLLKKANELSKENFIIMGLMKLWPKINDQSLKVFEEDNIVPFFYIFRYYCSFKMTNC